MESNKSNRLKTGTTTVGLVCTDGIVLAADRRATAGSLLVDKKVVKILEIAPNMAITTAGVVSDIQLLAKVIRAEIRLKNLHVGRDASVKEVANLVSNLQYNTLRRTYGIAAFILGGVDRTGPALWNLSPDGAMTKSDEYVCTGSGSVFAMGVLENEFKQGLTVDDAVEVARKAINASMQRDTMSGNGISILKITQDGCGELIEEEVNIGLY